MKTAYRISILTIAFFAAFALSSCVKGPDVSDESFDEGIVLTLDTGTTASVSLKSSIAPGDDDFNENLLNSVYYFFYPKGATGVEPSVSGFKTGLSETGTYTLKIPASTATIVGDLFASSNECNLFVVANPPASAASLLEGKPTLAELRALAVLSSLKSVPQSNFVMVYDGTVQAASLSAKIAVNATVEMKRLASKFTIGAYVIPSIIQDDAEYTPDGVSVFFCNGVNRTTLGGWNKDIVQSDDYFNTDLKPMSVPSDPERQTITINEGTEEAPDFKTYNKYELTSPIYSYPMEWEFNGETEPYLMYEVDWKISQDGSTSWKPLYYKMTLGRRSVTQNEWYDISGKLTILGSLYPEEPTEIYYYMDYLVKDWKKALEDDGISTPAVIKDTRYIAVSQKDWTLNNKETVTIPYSSSHKCEVVNTSIRTTSYAGGIPDSTATPHYPTFSYDLSQPDRLTVRHQINNNLGAGMDCAPIIIEFDLRHISTDTLIQQKFIEHIRIVQNPAIVIKTEPNTMGPGNGTQDDNGTKLGYVYVNKVQSTNNDGSSGTDWRRIAGATSSGNNSSYFFTIITPTQFDPSTGFVVGDPRKKEIDNLNVASWNRYACENAPAKYKGDGQTGNRKLKYYHPTVDDGTMDNVVAPSFRVSSGYCRSRQNNTYSDIKLRCASYQEDGYPAGRWRVPTLAECKLTQVLSSNGIVPNIYIKSGTSNYFAAGWWFHGNASGDSDWYHSTTTDSATRCVYDEWYWSQVDAQMGWDNSDKTTFTWGDVPDDFVIPTN